LADFPALLDGGHATTEQTKQRRRLAGVLLFGGFRDHDNEDRVIVGREMCRWVAGVGNRRGFAAGPILEDFSMNVFPLRINDYSYSEGRARTVAIPQDIADRYRPRRHQADDLVDIRTGNKWNWVQRRELKDLMAQYLAELAKAADGHPARDVLHYLNSQPGKRFAHDPAGMDTAWDHLESLWEHDHDRTRHHVLANARALERLEAGPPETPLYHPVLGTTRLYSGHSLHTVSSAYRRLLLPTWTEVDLVSAHLATVCKTWGGLPVTRKFLESGASIWESLLDWCGLGPEDKAKAKDACYSLLYGRRIGYHIRGGPMTRDQNRRLLEHPVIAEIVAQRRVQMAIIRAAGGCHDAFGTWLPLQRDNMLTLLAAQSQSWELKLTRLLYREFIIPDGIPCLHSHDGMSLKLPAAHRDEVLADMVAFVKDACDHYGIPSGLVIKAG
jgi:hypothetical protein